MDWRGHADKGRRRVVRRLQAAGLLRYQVLSRRGIALLLLQTVELQALCGGVLRRSRALVVHDGLRLLPLFEIGVNLSILTLQSRSSSLEVLRLLADVFESCLRRCHLYGASWLIVQVPVDNVLDIVLKRFFFIFHFRGLLGMCVRSLRRHLGVGLHRLASEALVY